MIDTRYEAVVVGGGIHGLSAAFHLCLRGCGPIALIDQFDLLHDKGSSHGHSRVTRSTYGHADYVRLMGHLHETEWPLVERETGRRLIHRCPGLFFGPADGELRHYITAVTQAGAEVEWVEADEARRRFPLFSFVDSTGALVDHTAGLIAAADALRGLADYCQQRQVTFFPGTKIRALESEGRAIRVLTERGELHAERLICAAGPWSGQLFPELAPRLAVARQTVLYLRGGGPTERFQLGAFPVWVYIGRQANDLYYGLPQFGRPGLKLARHQTAERNDDPDQTAVIDSDEVERVMDFARRQWTCGVEEVLGVEHCLYTNTPTEDFVIDRHPEHPQVAVAAGFSGHGFKFGPFVGRALAELALDGAVSMPAFAPVRERFAWPRG